MMRAAGNIAALAALGSSMAMAGELEDLQKAMAAGRTIASMEFGEKNCALAVDKAERVAAMRDMLAESAGTGGRIAALMELKELAAQNGMDVVCEAIKAGR